MSSVVIALILMLDMAAELHNPKWPGVLLGSRGARHEVLKCSDHCRFGDTRSEHLNAARMDTVKVNKSA